MTPTTLSWWEPAAAPFRHASAHSIPRSGGFKATRDYERFLIGIMRSARKFPRARQVYHRNLRGFARNSPSCLRFSSSVKYIFTAPLLYNFYSFDASTSGSSPVSMIEKDPLQMIDVGIRP